MQDAALQVTPEVGTLVPVEGQSLFYQDREVWARIQFKAEMLAKSDFIPERHRDKPANCIMAMEIAHRSGGSVSELAILQHMYSIKGNPGIDSQLANTFFEGTGKWEPIEYAVDKSTENWKCVASSKHIPTGKVHEGPEVTLEMAKAEGWSSKPGSKWKTLPELMLMYRSAVFLIRTKAPSCLLGLYTKEEVVDMIEISPGVHEAAPVEETVIGQELKDEGVEPGTIDIPAEPDPRFDAKLAQWDKLVEESGVPVANVEKYLDAGEFPKDEDTPPAFTNRDSYKVRFVDAGHHRVRGFLENVQKAFQAEDPDPEETESTLICEHCDFEAKSERGLKKHITQQHSESTPAQDAEEMVAEVKKDLDAISDLVDPEVVEPEIVEPDPEQAARDDAYFTAFEKKMGEFQRDFQNKMEFDLGNAEYFSVLNKHGVENAFHVRDKGDKQLAIEINNAMADTLAAT